MTKRSFPSRLNKIVCNIMVASAMLLGLAGPTSGQTEVSPVVRMIYLIPSGRPVSYYNFLAIQHAIQHLQIWYRNEMGNGKTFKLHDPIVEVYNTPHTADWYAHHDSGRESKYWFRDNVLADGFSLTGGRANDPNNRWIFYIDADHDPALGQTGGLGWDGWAVLPANDLRGLVGNSPEGVCRWVGGLGHELGHALDLHHPSCDDGDPNTLCSDAYLMELGYDDYPNAHLRPADKDTLNQSPFFLPLNTSTALFDCSNLLTTYTDVALTIGDSPDPVVLGEYLTYKIAVKNYGPDVAGPVTLTDTLPASVAFVSAASSQGSCSGTSTVTCDLGFLANGSAAGVFLVVMPTQAGVISNTATVASPAEYNTWNNTATAVTTAKVLQAPSNLTATAVSSSQINLQWQDNSGSETHFQVQRKTGFWGTWSIIATLRANTASFANTGLAAKTTYYYRVRACNGAGCSAWSNDAWATTLASKLLW